MTSASLMLFGNMLNLCRGIFFHIPVTKSSLPLPKYLDSFLSIQENLIEASAMELLRTDEIHMKDWERVEYAEFFPNSFVLVHYLIGLLPTRMHTHWRGIFLCMQFPQVWERVQSHPIRKNRISCHHSYDLTPSAASFIQLQIDLSCR